MYAYGTHYARYTTDPALLYRIATPLAKHILTVADGRIPILCGTGLSGTTLVSTAAMKIQGRNCNTPKVYVIYARPYKHTSHGDDYELGPRLPAKIAAAQTREAFSIFFLDDFIESGDTMLLLHDRVTVALRHYISGIEFTKPDEVIVANQETDIETSQIWDRHVPVYVLADAGYITTL